MNLQARGGDTSETGSEAKWDDVMWSVFMDKDFELRLTVTSGSVVLGFIVLSPEDLSGKPIDKLGLTNVSLVLVVLIFFEVFFVSPRLFTV